MKAFAKDRSKTVEIEVTECYLDCPDYYVLPGLDGQRVSHPGHAGYQRDTWQINAAFLEKATADFHPARFEQIHVVKRPIMTYLRNPATFYDGGFKYAIIDGGGRWCMAQMLGLTVLEARIHGNVTTVQEEAELFTKLNKDRRRVTPMQWFRASIAEGNKTSVAIDADVREAGYHLGTGTHGLSCIAALEHAHKLGVLKPVLFHMSNAYDGMKLPTVYVAGLSYIQAFTRGNLDVESYRALLTKTVPKALFTKIAEDHHGARPHPTVMPRLVALELAERYNRNKKNKRIAVAQLAEYCGGHPWGSGTPGTISGVKKR